MNLETRQILTAKIAGKIATAMVELHGLNINKMEPKNLKAVAVDAVRLATAIVLEATEIDGSLPEGVVK